MSAGTPQIETVTVSTTEEAIVANADYHNHLLSTLSQLDYAEPALTQHRSYIADLEAQIARSDKKIEELAVKTKKERKEHEQLRDSTARRLAARLTGKKEKFEAREEKEEREYVEALQNEMVERDNRNMLQQLLTEALSERQDLEQKVKKHASLRDDLNKLYSRVFDGPSQSFPEEDRLEYDVHDAHRRHEEAQRALNAESQATELLARASGLMDRCQGSISEALRYSRYDMMGGGSMADYMERNALTNAQAYALQVESLVDQAIRISPTVQPVGRVNIASGSLMSDVFFDNFFTDMAFHKKIQNSAAQVVLANNRLKAELSAAAHRRDAAGNRLMAVSRELDDRRQELFELRKALFESVAAQVPKPPSYDTVFEPPPGPPPGHPEYQRQQQQQQQQQGTPASPPPAFPVAEVGSVQADPSQVAEPQPMTTSSSTSSLGEGEGSTSPRPWGSRNPYAAAIAARSDSFSKSST
ncbi:hypothetical protein CC2G_002057 [Coprinopsis cinerea AmutBmut pab1-1]|nr:hypothetical protein CC2G_002057 [Coprinopsis cinerea AmutBmut pab1-1]